jgi:hypothetical protein
MKQVKGGGRGDASALARSRPFSCGDHTTNTRSPACAGFSAIGSSASAHSSSRDRLRPSRGFGDAHFFEYAARLSRFKRGQVSQVSRLFLQRLYDSSATLRATKRRILSNDP